MSLAEGQCFFLPSHKRGLPTRAQAPLEVNDELTICWNKEGLGPKGPLAVTFCHKESDPAPSLHEKHPFKTRHIATSVGFHPTDSGFDSLQRP